MFTMEITRLIERCRQGDADALGELYKAYAQRMKGVCRRYVSDEQAVDDVLHDAFVIIFTSFDRLRDNRKAESWMMSITRNVASKYKDHLKSLSFVPLEEAESLVAPNEEITVKGVPLEEVLKLIDKLPEGYGKVFRLSVFEGMSHREIADMLGIEPHSSSSQLARAKKILRKMMKQYWAAVLLLLLMPFTFFLLRKSDTAVKEEKPAIAKQEDTPKHNTHTNEPSEEEPQEPIIVHIPVHQAPIDMLLPIIAQALDSIMPDSLANTIAQEQTIPDTIKNNEQADTTHIIDKPNLPHYDITDLLPDKQVTRPHSNQKWSIDLAYAGGMSEKSQYNQPFIYKPTPSDVQSLPSGHEPTIPSSIDNWTDYAVYLANNPYVVSEKTRSVIMRIALNNANRPGEDKILRTSHHQMPVTWSLALKYRLGNRFGLESGLSYSCLTSDFEMGADGNTIHEQQTIHYLGVPVKGNYNIYNRKMWSLYGSLGFTTEVPVHSTLHSDYYVNGQYEFSDKAIIRAPWQFSTTFGLGLQFHLTPSVGIFAEPSLQYYIPTRSGIETYRTEHPFTFSLPLGIRFTW